MLKIDKMMEADNKSKFHSLLIRISKLLSKRNVEELVFATMTYIDNRSLSEEFQASGNALKIFQAMIDRELYTFEDPSLLIDHLQVIGRHDAVKLLEQEIGSSSRSNHTCQQQTGAPLNQGFRERIPIITWRPAASPSHAINPGPWMDPTQLPLDNTLASSASVAQPGDVFIDGANTGTRIQTVNSKRPEPEASLPGDPNSPRNLPDIPDNNNSAATDHSVRRSERKCLLPVANTCIPEIPKRPPRCKTGVEGCSNNKPQGRCKSLRKTGDPVIGLQKTYTATDSTPRPGRPTCMGLDGMSLSGIEVEHLQRSRAPPVPPRPYGRPDNAVTDLELSQLSSHLDAKVVNLFGHELGFRSGRISQLRHDNPHDVSRVFYRLMIEWKNKQQISSNMRGNLANHLRYIGCVELADDLKAGQFR